MIVELGQLEAFLQVASHRSFSKAAEVLFLTQPSVTARIQSLERELGEEMFERSGRSVRLTDAGNTFLAYAQRAIQAVQEGRDALEALRKTEAGSLRLGSALTVSAYVLPRILRTFRARYPGVEVSVRTGRSDQVLDMVLADDVQVGLVRSLVHPEIETVHLYDDELVLVTAPDHEFTKSRSVRIEEIARQSLIFFDRASSYYGLIHGFFRDAGLVPRHAMDLDSLEATKMMVEEGLGIAILPRVSVEREMKLNLLVEIEVLGVPRVKRQIAMIYRRNRRHARTVGAFIEALYKLYRFDLPENGRALVARETAAAPAEPAAPVAPPREPAVIAP
ncbi:MAG: LysR family transcriptional regulator [Dehalococcoidia bacterium]